MFVGKCTHSCDLGGRARASEDSGSAWHCTCESPVQSERPPIPAGLGGGVKVGDYLADRSELIDKTFGKFDTNSGQAIGVTGEFDGRDWLTHREDSDSDSELTVGCEVFSSADL
jgi:hypothetical protein